MATNIVASQTNHIVSGTLGDKTAVSCGGVPGTGTLDSAYIYVNTYITTLLDDDGHLWFANTSGRAYQTGMIDIYGVAWYIHTMIRNRSFSITYVGNFEDTYAGQYFQRTLWHSAVASENFTGSVTYNVSTNVTTVSQAESLGYYDSGYSLDDFPREGNTTNVTVYVMYPINYGVGDTAVTLTALPFTFSFSQILEYYPFARYSGGWLSCNREGGSLTKYSGSSWTDLKNIEGSASESTVFNYSGSAWEIAPKIGEE